MKLRNTLRVYYRLGQNTAAAARELNVAERTVRYRLRLAEERLGASVMPDEVALAIRLFAALEAQAKARPSAVTAANDAAPVTVVEADAEFEPAEDPELDSADPAALLARRFELGAEHHNEIDLAQAERG
jgi:transposase-like protein